MSQEAQVRSVGGEDPLEKEMAAHFSIFAWRHEQKGLVGYSPRDHKKSDTTERISLSAFQNLDAKHYLIIPMCNLTPDLLEHNICHHFYLHPFINLKQYQKKRLINLKPIYKREPARFLKNRAGYNIS